MWHALKRSRSLWWIVAIAAIVSCARTQPIRVDLAYVSPDDREEAPRSVVVHLAPVVDARSNQEAIGQTTVPVLPASDVLAWIQDGLLSLDRKGFEVRMSGSDAPQGFRIRVAVTRVFCRSKLTSLRSSIVLSVEYFRDGALIGTRQHRGEYTYRDRGLLEGDYRYSEGRVLEVLNGGLADVVSQIAATLRELEGT